MTDSYNNLTQGPKRLIWVGYVAYLVWMNLFGGWDLIIDAHFKPITNSDAIDFLIMFALYWIVVLLVVWVLDAF